MQHVRYFYLHVFRWLFIAALLGISGLVIWRWSVGVSSRRQSLALMQQAALQPTPPLRFDAFKIDNTPLQPLSSSSAKSVASGSSTVVSETLLGGSLSTDRHNQVFNLEPRQTPTSLNPLNPEAKLSIPYIRGLDLIVNQDGQEVLVLRGSTSSALTKVTYAFPMISPNGKLVAFFEWLQPKIKNQLVTADLGVLKILDLNTGKIKTTSYRFLEMAHDLDGGLPVKWNSRNYLEIEQQDTPLRISHILYDPDRAVLMAENNLSLISQTPWPQQHAQDILRGFSISPDGQWQVTTDDQQFLLQPVGSTKKMPILLSEIKDGHLVRLYGWQGNEVWFAVEQKAYQSCLNTSMLSKKAELKIAAHTQCFTDTHYLLSVDAGSQQVKRRWYNFQVGQLEQLRWIRLPFFLDRATLNSRGEIVYFEPHVPILYSVADNPRLSSAFDNKKAIMLTNSAIELLDLEGQKNPIRLDSGVTTEMLAGIGYWRVWTGNNQYVVLYASGYDQLSAQRILVVDIEQRVVKLVTASGSLFVAVP